MQTMRSKTRRHPTRGTTIRAAVGLTAAIALAAIGLLAAGALAGNARQSSATLSLRSTGLGKVLVSSKGRTLYLFRKDRNGKSACAGQCAKFWPPLIARGKVTVGKGLKASLVGQARRSNGAMQVTYAKHPLYTFALDKAPGQTHGQGLLEFGAKWFAVSAKGTPVVRAPTGTTTTPTTTTTYSTVPYP